jgi:predicted transcriptional regulator
MGAGVQHPGRAGEWTFVTTHLLVLLCIAEDPRMRMSDVASRVGVTERAVQRIIADLVDTGYLARVRMGRRNVYEINADMPLRHLETQHKRLGDLLAVLSHDRKRRV